jgi:hypothetical protein
MTFTHQHDLQQKVDAQEIIAAANADHRAGRPSFASEHLAQHSGSRGHHGTVSQPDDSDKESCGRGIGPEIT